MRSLILLLAIITSFGIAKANSSSEHLAVQPLGAIADSIVRDLCADLSEALNIPVRQVPRSALPEAAYYPPRKRYRAQAILDWLETNRTSDMCRLLGVTDSDISTPKPPHPDWGIFGLSYVGRPVVVVSTFRLHGSGPGALPIRTRLYRIALHELGHTFGLDHCSSQKCLMADAKGRIQSVDEGDHLCMDCAKAFGGCLRPPKEPEKIRADSTTIPFAR